MSEKQNKWNPDKFTTKEGEFFGRVIPKAGGLTILRSSSLLGAEVGDRVVIRKCSYRVTSYGKTKSGSPMVRLEKEES